MNMKWGEIIAKINTLLTIAKEVGTEDGEMKKAYNEAQHYINELHDLDVPYYVNMEGEYRIDYSSLRTITA